MATAPLNDDASFQHAAFALSQMLTIGSRPEGRGTPASSRRRGKWTSWECSHSSSEAEAGRPSPTSDLGHACAVRVG